MSAAFIQVYFRLDFLWKQTIWVREPSDLGPYCLQYKLPKNISRRKEQMTKVDHDWQAKCSICSFCTDRWWGDQWLSGRVLDLRPRGCGFEPHPRHCVVVLEQDTFIPA